MEPQSSTGSHEADWWGHSVTVFAAYAVEAGVFIHRLARRGVVTFADAVPFYGKVLLPLLTLLPMACLFAYRHDDVSFWELFLDWQ